MAKYLVTFSDQINNVDVNGFAVMTENEVSKFENSLLEINWPFSHTIGGVSLDYSSGDDYLTRLEFKEITNEEYKILNRVFDGQYGLFISQETIDNLIIEDEPDSIYDSDDSGDWLFTYEDEDYE